MPAARQIAPVALLLLLAACAAPAERPETADLDAAECLPFDSVASYAVEGPGVLHLLDAQGRRTHVLRSAEAARAGLSGPGAGSLLRVALAFPDGRVCPGDGRSVQMTVADRPVAVDAVEIAPARGCPMPDHRSVLRHHASLWCLAQAAPPA